MSRAKRDGSVMVDEAAEKAMLGALMQSAIVRDDFGWMSPEYFGSDANAQIWTAIQAMHGVGEAVDLVTVTSRLEQAGVLDRCGGASYLTECVIECPGTANADHYARIVADKYLRRKTMAACHELLGRVQDMGEDGDQLLGELETMVLRLREDGSRHDSMVHIKSALDDAVKNIERCYANRGKITGLCTGFVDWDRCTMGLKGGQFVVVAARPGSGKTSWTLQAAAYMARQGPVAYFSMEMTEQELANRLLANEARVNIQRTKDGFLAKQDVPRIVQSASDLSQLSIWIDSKPSLTIHDFRARARKCVRSRGCVAIYVDYLQLMRSTSKRANESRAIEIAEISMSMKATAKELGIPVIACAQLSREAEKRVGPPRLSDLRESGQIEQDADIVAFLHREKKREEDGAAVRDNNIQLIIAKHRDGPPAEINLRFVAESARFENVTEKMFSNNEEERQR